MNDSTLERRRAPRITLASGDRLPLSVSLPAQVLEINVSGLLLGSQTELAIGERGELRMTIGKGTLDVAIEIRAVSRETRAHGGPRYRLGAAFVGMTAEQRARLMELLGAQRN